MRYIQALIAAVVLLVPSLALAQNPKNPTAVEFTSADHDHPEVTGYELDIVTAQGEVRQTLSIPKATVAVVPGTSPTLYRVTVNVQPVTFGSYTFVARTVAGAVKGSDSPPSDAWDRAPGAPSKPVVK